MPNTNTVDLNNFLIEHSGSLTYDIYRRELNNASPWFNLPRKVAWVDGIGEKITNTMWERPFVRVENPWGQMTLNDGTGNSCIPPVDIVEFSHVNRDTYLYHKAVHSPYFCVTDLLYTGRREQQMRNVEAGLSEIVRRYWINWNRDGFTKISTKVVIAPGFPRTDESDGLTFPATAPTSILTQGVLDYFTNILMSEGGPRHALTTSNGRPVYGLITDQNTARALILGKDALREDYRNSSKADDLLAPLGVTHTYNGYVYMMDEAPPRWNFNPAMVEAGTDDPLTSPWVEVPYYILDTVTYPGKTVRVVNPAWFNAGFQDSYIYVKDAYQIRVPGSITSVSKATFNPQHYMGDFRWQNVIDIDETSPTYNPDGIMGRFRGVMAAGVEPINPHVMFTLRHMVCPPDLGLIGCV